MDVPMLCSYEELQEMCSGQHVEQLFRNSRQPFRGRVQHQNSTTTDVMIHWQTAAPVDQELSRFREWLDEMSRLQHPHVLPLVGACLDPPALVVPFMQVSFSACAHFVTCQLSRKVCLSIVFYRSFRLVKVMPSKTSWFSGGNRASVLHQPRMMLLLS